MTKAPHDTSFDETSIEPGGPTFGRYRLLEEVGRGGMGVVWKAWDPTLKRVVALKRVRKEGAADPQTLRRFVREARAAARLRHPSIVPVYEVGVEGEEHYLAAEFVEGRALDRAVPGRLPPERAAEIVRDVALALQVAHEAGVVHRDVKPGNILLNREGRPRLTDFGLATDLSRSGESRLTTAGAFMGTPLYMSPEQAEGRTGDVGPASDQFSLGVVFYELLTGKRAFEGQALRAILNAVCEEAPVPPRGIDPRIPIEFEEICLRAMEKSPSDRWPSMAEFASALGNALEGRATGREDRPGSRRRLLAGIAAGGLVLLFGAWVAIPARARPPAPEVPARDPLFEVRDEFAALVGESYDGRTDPGHWARRVADARRRLEPVLPAEPSAEGFTLLAGLEELEGAYPAAERSARRAVELDPRSADARLVLSRILALRAVSLAASRRSDPDTMLLALESAQQAERAGAGGEPSRAVALAVKRFLERDLAAMGEAAESALPGSAGKRGSELLLALVGFSKPEAGEAALEDALARRPFDPLPYLLLGRVAVRRGSPDRAIEHYGRALHVAPRFAIALANRSAARAEMGDLDAARADLDEAIRLEPDEPRHYTDRASVRGQAGDTEGAIADASEALRLDPRCGIAHHNRGQARLAQRDLAGAAADFDAALELDSSLDCAFVARGILRLDGGDLAGAISDLGQSIRLNPSEPLAFSHRGVARWSSGDRAGAFEDLEAALRLAPRLPHALAARASMLLLAGEPRAAIADLDLLLEIEPENPSALRNRAVARLRLGDREGGESDLFRAFELAPPGPERAKMEAELEALRRR